MGQQLLIAFVVSVIICAFFYWRGSLSRSGVAGAMVVGVCILGIGGWVWGVILGVFFVSSSLLSHFKEDEKKVIAAEKFDKGHERDWGQTMANGGLGAAVAVLSAVFPAPYWFPLFMGLMGTVTADTWATELGTLAKRPPRLITTFHVVEPGTSGGVSLLGTAVSLLGGGVIGLTAGLLEADTAVWVGVLVGGIGGLSGSLFDSLLGATVQAIYMDEGGQETERKVDKSGRPTRHLRGWKWLNNDLVNTIASVVGGGVALGVWGLVRNVSGV